MAFTEMSKKRSRGGWWQLQRGESSTGHSAHGRKHCGRWRRWGTRELSFTVAGETARLHWRRNNHEIATITFEEPGFMRSVMVNDV